MRIAFVVHTFFPNWQAGTEVYARSLAREAIANGHEPFIACYEPPGEGESFDGIRASDTTYEGLPVHRVSFLKRHRIFHRKDYFHKQVEDHLVQYFSQVAPDVVHVVHAMHLSTASIWAAKRLDLPVVSTATDFWSVCPTYQLVKWDESLCSGPDPLMCLACLDGEPADRWMRRLCRHERAIRLLSPLAVSVASIPLRRSEWLASLIWLSERRAWMKKTLSKVDVLVIPTPNTGRVFLANGLRPHSVRNLGFGLDTSLFAQAKAPTRSPVLRIGYVGTFRRSKGLHVLLDSMRQIPAERVHLDIYGAKGQFPQYEATLFELAGGRKNVEFCGTFPNEKLADVFSSFDVLVIPSLWHENSPLVLLSAFALHTPVIVSRIGSLADLVEHEKSGLTFEMGNSADLARQLQRLLDDPHLLERIRAGSPTVKTVDENFEELREIYKGLTGAGNSEPMGSRPFEAPREKPLLSFRLGALFCQFRLLLYGAQFGNGLALLKCQTHTGASGEVTFDIVWHCRELSADWVVFIHFLDEGGAIQAQGDHQLGYRDPDPWGYVSYRFTVRIPETNWGRMLLVRLGVWSPDAKMRLPTVRARGLEIEERESALSLGKMLVRGAA